MLDSDIEVKNDTVLQLIKYMKDNPAVARMTGKSIFNLGTNKGKVDRPTPQDRTFKKDNTTFIEGIYGRYECYYKTPFLEVGGYDNLFEYCGEGTDISVKFWRAGYPLGYDENILAYHNTEAPNSLRRSNPDKMANMYLSLFLVAYKYDVFDINNSPNFIKSSQERKNAYGDTLEFHAIVSAAKSFNWIAKNISKIKKSKEKIPNNYNFKPFDIFTDKEEIDKCLNAAKEKIKPFYKKVFN